MTKHKILYIIVLLSFVSVSTILIINIDKNKFKNGTENYQEKNQTFLYENNDLKQTVEIKKLTKDVITFKLISENKLKKLNSSIEGIANGNDENLGSESDCCNERGDSYFVREYTFSDSNCWLSFRIDKDTEKTMKITEADCKIDTKDTPFESVDTLIKQ